jgi:hypothetical protein
MVKYLQIDSQIQNAEFEAHKATSKIIYIYEKEQDLSSLRCSMEEKNSGLNILEKSDISMRLNTILLKITKIRKSLGYS